jgi:hypothetical protein
VVTYHLDEIRDYSEFTVPGGPADEMGELFGTIRRADAVVVPDPHSIPG